MKTKNIAYLCAIFAAGLYAINIPLSKLLLKHIEPTMMAAFLYLGAGIGLLLYTVFKNTAFKKNKGEPLTKKELPYTIAMVVLDIIAPILLMMGILITNSANVSLLSNFEIVSTSLIALLIFKETISKRLWLSIILVTISSIILSFEGTNAFVCNQGSLFVLGACLCWGFENNCTKMISNKNPVEIVTIKGIFSGLGSLIVAIILNENIPEIKWIICALILGFVSYGLSICLYINAQKNLGAAKTSAFYSTAPFLGVIFSIFILGEKPDIKFCISLLIILISTGFMIKDTITLQHTHEHEHIHNHEHRHGDIVHTHEHSHKHIHIHIHSEKTEDYEHFHNNNELKNHKHIHTTAN